ncbi:uncharacterized protein LOC127079526 [Lathyrus oleraceus]|uniref:uncharacterized protein LOC127079526 n=1 Tax=Pisum sativum TaxID=3888 RepID=UPI0021D0771A|nr:uncharacterized protein LOC127079526 [Pisum sativum]
MHKILLEDGSRTARQTQRRLNPLILSVVKKEVTKLLQAGIIYPIFDNKWVSPVQVIPKKYGLTVVIFIFILHQELKKIPFYVPIQYICLQEDACNAPGMFQRCMINIFADFIENYMEVFMDDFTVYGSSFDACLNNLNLVLERCIETDLVLNYEKCHFMVEHGIVLGHIISEKGISVDPAKVDVISTPFLQKLHKGVQQDSSSVVKLVEE